MVKCTDCGFLTLRHVDTRELCEAEAGYRNTGVIPGLVGHRKEAYEAVPLCLQQKANFHDYLNQNQGPEMRLSVLQQERDCTREDGGYTTWQQGFSPKEHREMLDREALRKWQSEREDADREWREGQDTKRDDRQAALLWQLAGVAGLFTLIGAAAGAVIAAVLSR